MRRKPLESSSLRSVGYDEATAVLEVEFDGGAVYRYFAVPKKVHDALMAAPSKGAFLNERVKPVYPVKRVR